VARKRIIFQNWIADLGFDPSDRSVGDPDSKKNWPEISIEDLPESSVQTGDTQASGRDETGSSELGRAVRVALDKLTEDEREFVCQFYFMGRSYREISEESARAVYSLEALHRRAMKKLEKHLAAFVKKRFGIASEVKRPCIICQSPRLAEINKLIEQRDKAATWKPVMKRLLEEFGIEIKSPQLLIGHEKYH
jgi:RNA polymerase sigma factor (sigma-70 family)